MADRHCSPLLLHPAPQHALFLGLGTGVTATAATLRTPRWRSTCRAAAGCDPRCRSLHRSRSKRGAWRPRLHLAGRRPALRAHRQRALRRIVADNFHSGPQRLRARCTPSSTSRPCATGCTADGAVLPVAAAASAGPRHAAQHRRARSPIACIRTARRCSPATASRRPCSAWSAALTTRGFYVDHARPAPREQPAADGRKLATLGLEDELALLGSLVAGPSRPEPVGRRRRRSTPTTAQASPTARPASPTHPTRRRAIDCTALLGELVEPPNPPSCSRKRKTISVATATRGLLDRARSFHRSRARRTD